MTGSAHRRDIRTRSVSTCSGPSTWPSGPRWTRTEQCPECREELAGLAGLPGPAAPYSRGEAQQLAGDDLDELPGAEVPSDEMLQSLLARTTPIRQPAGGVAWRPRRPGRAGQRERRA